MNRRELLVGAGALAAAAVAHAAPQKEKAPEAGHGLLDAAAECAKRAELCLTHCLTMLGNGDTSMAACAVSVRETLATSRALIEVSAAGGKHQKELAKVCAAVCKDCEVECRKHQDKMVVCRECADACAKMIQEVGKMA